MGFMEHGCPNYLEQIPAHDWEKNPASVKKMVDLMAQRNRKIRTTECGIARSPAAIIRKSK